MPRAEPNVLARAGELSIRRMCDDAADYALLARWLSDPRVLEFVYGRDNAYSLERVIEEWRPQIRGETDATPCLLFYRGQPAGYIQYYPVSEAERQTYELPEATDAYGIDLFIGEPELWDQGLGTQAVEAMLRYLFEERGAGMVAIDPRVLNARAVRCYEKCGFRKRKLLPAYELHEGRYWDNWLMVIERPPTTVP